VVHFAPVRHLDAPFGRRPETRGVVRFGVWSCTLVVVAVCVFRVTASYADAEAPLVWGPSLRVDDQPPFAEPATVASVSCPSDNLCVAVANTGEVISNTDPVGAPRAWTEVSITAGLNSVSCPSESLCVATGRQGVFISTDPAGGATAWGQTKVGSSDVLRDVSCPSSQLCVAISGPGEVVTTTDPTGGSSAWDTAVVDPPDKEGGGNYLYAVSCTATLLCVAIDESGNVVTSTNPTGGPSAWHVTHVTEHILASVSCPSAQLCVVTDEDGELLTSTEPAGGAGFWQTTKIGASIEHVACSSATLCVGTTGNPELEVMSSTNPAGGTSAWRGARVEADSRISLTSVACSPEGLCVLGDSATNLAIASEATSGSGAWTPTHIEAGKSGLYGVSCTSGGGLCVAVGGAGSVVSTSDPASGSWSVSHVSGASSLSAVSCPSERLCVAVGSGGAIATTTDPIGGDWSVSNVSGDPQLSAVSCASQRLCVAVGESGTIATTTDPIGGDWSVTHVAEERRLNAVSCPSEVLCVALDSVGDAVTSSEPGNPDAPWSVVGVSAISPEHISCPSTSLCVATAGTEVVTSSDPTGGAEAWTARHVEDEAALFEVSCASVSLCVSTTFDGLGLLEGHAAFFEGEVLVSSAPGSPGETWSAANIDGHDELLPEEVIPAPLSEVHLTGVSCATAGVCVVAGTEGEVIVGTTAQFSIAREEGETRGSEGDSNNNNGQGSTNVLSSRTAQQAIVLFSLRRLRVTKGRIELNLDAPRAGTFVAAAQATANATSGSHKANRATAKSRRHPMIAYGAASRTVGAAGPTSLVIKPRKSAMAALNKSHQLRVTITVTFTPLGGRPERRIVTVDVRR
jgi:hypothetical protein